MRFKQRVHKYTDKESLRAHWHGWFAWYPVRITHSKNEEKWSQEGALRTDRACADARPIVWLERIERRIRHIRGCHDFQYRLKDA